VTAKRGRPRGTALRRFGRNRLALAGAAIVLVFLVGALCAPLLTAYNPTRIDLPQKLLPPTARHLLGTDELGRDLLTRILYGGRISFVASGLVIAIGLSSGAALGVLGAWYERIEPVVGAVTEILLSVPAILLALAIITALGPGAVEGAVAIGIAACPNFARLVRTTLAAVKHREYVEAARASGAGDARIILKYLVPNSLSPVIVLVTYQMSTALLTLATLSFIGLGAQPPTADWGTMLARGRDFLALAPSYPFVAGVPIVLLVLGFNLLGDGLRDALDPRLAGIRATPTG
jgi:peptide/nickel transport system permease protein